MHVRRNIEPWAEEHIPFILCIFILSSETTEGGILKCETILYFVFMIMFTYFYRIIRDKKKIMADLNGNARLEL